MRQAGEALGALRRQLPQNVTLWAGGEMTRRIRRTLPGVVLIPDLAAAIGALKHWRGSAAQTALLHTAPGLR